jgi:hypothetical protein
MTTWLAASPLSHAPILLGVSTLAGIGRLSFIVVRHFCKVHLLHEQVKAAGELAAAGLFVQAKIGAGDETEVTAGTPPGAIAQ